MRKNIVIIGLILLVIGVALFFGGGDLGLHGLVKSETMTAVSTNEYQSSSFSVTAGSIVIITSHPASSLYIVHTSDASGVNSSNIAHYEVSGGTSNNTSGVTTLEFTSLTAGSYTVVSFSDQKTSVTLTNEVVSSLILSLIPTLLGLLLGFIGFIVLIVGLVLKRKNPPLPDASY